MRLRAMGRTTAFALAIGVLTMIAVACGESSGGTTSDGATTSDGGTTIEPPPTNATAADFDVDPSQREAGTNPPDKHAHAGRVRGAIWQQDIDIEL